MSQSPSLSASPQPFRLLAWWYRLAAPAEPEPTAPLAQRELARRGRVTSLVMLVALALVIYALVLVPNVQIAVITAVITVIDLTAVMVFNKRQHIILAGFIITATAEFGILGSIIGDIQMHGGNVDITTLPFLALLVQAIIVGGSTLPSRFVFVLLALNTAIVVAVFFFLPHTPALTASFDNTYVLRNAFCVFTTIYLMVAFTTFIWVRSTNHSIRRADQAENVARLQAAMAQANRQAAQQKRDLEQGVNEIITCIATISNAPGQRLLIDHSHLLWQIVQALELLRKRLSGSADELAMYQRNWATTTQAIAQLIILVNQGQGSFNLTHWHKTNTPVDELAMTLGLVSHPTSKLYRSNQELRAALQHALTMLD